MEVKSFDFRKKKWWKMRRKDLACWKKKEDGMHVDLENEVNSIVVNNEEEKDVDGLEEK